MRKTQVRLSARFADQVHEIVAHLKDQSYSEDRSIRCTIPDNASATVIIESEDDGHVGTLLRELHPMVKVMGLTAVVIEDESSSDEVSVVQFAIDRAATEDDIRAQLDTLFPMACPFRKKVPKYKVLRSGDIVEISSNGLANADLRSFFSDHGGHVVIENRSLTLVEYSL